MAEKAKCSDTELGHNAVEDCLLGITILGPADADNIPLYRVHQENGVLICDRFLLGYCTMQECCPHHHTPFPYHWQWRRQKDLVWLSFSFLAQQHLERLYCNKKCTKVKLKDRTGSCYFLNLDTMKLSDNPLYDQVRRLSNSSDPTCNHYFPAEWKVYWEEVGYWKEYKEPIAQELVTAFKQKRQRHAFSLHNRHYKVNIKRLTQRNVKTGFTRRIKYRPVLRYGTSIARFLQSVALSGQARPIPGENPLDLYCGSYPAVWIPPPQGDVGFTMEEMTQSEMASLKVRELFHATLPGKQALVLAIYRIRNDHLWQAYMRQKERMSQECSAEDQLSMERHLFHGTGAACIKRICTENFHTRFSGLHGALYGKGIYFAKDAFYSHNYTSMTKGEVCHMFLTKVLTGYWTKGHSGLKQPPVSYNSCTNDTSNPDIFVIFKSCQCYPYFLIRYKELDMTVAIDA